MSSNLLIPFDKKSYILEVLYFLKEYSWIFNAPNVYLLTDNLLSFIPEKWISALAHIDNNTLNNLPLGQIEDSWPQNLKEFIIKCISLKVPAHIIKENDDISQDRNLGVNLKKSYEISKLANFVHSQCQIKGINCILDVGCGLGHLSYLFLNQKFGYKVLGLDKNPKLVSNSKTLPSDNFCIKECTVSLESKGEIELLINDFFGSNTQICLVGLHACGDLTEFSCHLFKNIKNISMMIILPCCYHKKELITDSRIEENINSIKNANIPVEDNCSGTQIKIKSEEDSNQTLIKKKELFKYFPSSEILSPLTEEISWFVKRPLFRLACQASPHQWAKQTEEEHKKHSFILISRACLQVYASQVNSYILRKKNKGIRINQMLDYDTCLKEMSERFLVKPYDKKLKAFESNEVYEELKKMWPKYSQLCFAAEIFTALQSCLQPLAEGLIFADRLAFLENNKNISAGAIQVLDQVKSPRGLAIMALKQS